MCTKLDEHLLQLFVTPYNLLQCLSHFQFHSAICFNLESNIHFFPVFSLIHYLIYHIQKKISSLAFFPSAWFLSLC